MKLLIFLLLTIPVQGQDLKWWKPTKRELVSYTLYAGSGTAYAYNQALLHHQYKRGNQFWDPTLSWLNKYKDYNNGDTRARFWGSKTILVSLTDAQHMTQTINVAFLTVGTAINFADLKAEMRSYPKKHRALAFVTKKILYPMVVRGITFEAFLKSL